MPRGAAQAELTEGAERSLEFAGKRMSKAWTSRRLHRIAFQGRRCGQEQARMDGKRRTPVSTAVAAGEGRSILPAKESFTDRRVWLRAHRDAL